MYSGSMEHHKNFLPQSNPTAIIYKNKLDPGPEIQRYISTHSQAPKLIAGPELLCPFSMMQCFSAPECGVL